MEKEEEYKGEDQVQQTVGSEQKGRQIRRRRPRYFFGQNSTLQPKELAFQRQHIMSLGQTEALFEQKSVALQSMRTDTLLELKCLYTDLYHTQEK